MEESNAVGSENLRIFVPMCCWEPGGSSRTGAEPSLQHSDFSTAKYQSGADKAGGWRWCALLPAPLGHWQANLSPRANSAKPAAATPLCKTRTQPGVSEACRGLENHLLGVLQSWVNTSRTPPRSPASQAAWAKVIKIEIKPQKQRQREEGENAVGPKGLRMWVLLGLIVFFLALRGGMLLGQCCCLLDCYWLGVFLIFFLPPKQTGKWRKANGIAVLKPRKPEMIPGCKIQLWGLNSLRSRRPWRPSAGLGLPWGRGGERPTSESGSGLDSEANLPLWKFRVVPRGSGEKSWFQPFSSNRSWTYCNNTSGPLMRKAIFFVMTVKYVPRSIPQSKVYIMLGLYYFCAAVHPDFTNLAGYSGLEHVEDCWIEAGRCLLTTCDLVSIISLESAPLTCSTGTWGAGNIWEWHMKQKPQAPVITANLWLLLGLKLDFSPNSRVDWTVQCMVRKEAVMIWSIFQANQSGWLQMCSHCGIAMKEIALSSEARRKRYKSIMLPHPHSLHRHNAEGQFKEIEPVPTN